jgi:hypothetical protein
MLSSADSAVRPAAAMSRSSDRAIHQPLDSGNTTTVSRERTIKAYIG